MSPDTDYQKSPLLSSMWGTESPKASPRSQGKGEAGATWKPVVLHLQAQVNSPENGESEITGRSLGFL